MQGRSSWEGELLGESGRRGWHQLSQGKGVCAIIEQVAVGGQEAAELRGQAGLDIYTIPQLCGFSKAGMVLGLPPRVSGPNQRDGPVHMLSELQIAAQRVLPADHSQSL